MRICSLLFGTLGTIVLLTPATAQQRPRPLIHGGLPAVSPDGRSIAFQATRDTASPGGIFLIQVDGTGERLLVPGGGPPVWMPDGKALLLSTPRASVLVDVKTGTTRPLPTPDGRGFLPSPDGKWLAYSAGTFPSVRLAVVGVDGGSPRWLTDSSGTAFNAVWSPDGTRLAYARLDSTRDMQVWLVNADGTNARQLTHFAGVEGRPQWPSWSPDGKTLAVQSGVYNSQDPGTSSAHIWLLDVSSGTARKIAPHDEPWLDETPSFFPDGKRIAFQSDRTGRMEIWVMDVDGRNARQVTR